jgi:hypothetical protein
MKQLLGRWRAHRRRIEKLTLRLFDRAKNLTIAGIATPAELLRDRLEKRAPGPWLQWSSSCHHGV